jgi:hypothetical protein
MLMPLCDNPSHYESDTGVLELPNAASVLQDVILIQPRPQFM